MRCGKLAQHFARIEVKKKKLEETMNKTELVAHAAEVSGITKKDTDVVLTATLDAIKNALVSGDSVQLVGFGTFEVRNRSARTARNPQTGETVIISATRVPSFKPGKALKDAVAGK